MPHHFTKSTVEASIFCNTCMKETRWKVADGRRQYCLKCQARRDQARVEKAETPTEQQFNLFQKEGD